MLKYESSQRATWQAFRRALDARDYEQTTRLLQGLYYFYDPWLGEDSPRFYHELMPLADETRVLFELLLLGGPVDQARLEKSLSAGLVKDLMDLGFLVVDQDDASKLHTDQYGIICQNGMYFIITFPHPKATDPQRAFRVYIGQDSFKLVHAMDRSRRGIRALDLCAGSGIIGQTFAPYAGHVDAVELCEEAIDVSRTNAAINGVDDVWSVHLGDLWAPVKDQSYDLIVTNPPFVAVPTDTGSDFPIYGWGGEDGLLLIRKILEGAPAHLNPGGRFQMVFEGVGNGEGAAIEPLIEAYAKEHPEWSLKLTLYGRMFLWERPMKVAGEAIANMQGDASEEQIERHTLEVLQAHYQRDYTYTYKAFLTFDTDPVIPPGLDIQRLYNPWDLKHIPQRTSPVTYQPWTHQVMRNYWGTSLSVNDQQHKVIEALDGNRSLQDAAQHVWADVGGPMSGTTPGLFVESGLEMCRIMHQLGFLQHPEGHWDDIKDTVNPYLGKKTPIEQTFDAIENMLKLMVEVEKQQTDDDGQEN